MKPDPDKATDRMGKLVQCIKPGRQYCEKHNIDDSGCVVAWTAYKDENPREADRMIRAYHKCEKDAKTSNEQARNKKQGRPWLNMSGEKALAIGKAVGAVDASVMRVPSEHCEKICKDKCNFNGPVDLRPFVSAYAEALGMLTANQHLQTPLKKLLVDFLDSPERRNCPHRITTIGSDIRSWRLNSIEYCRAEAEAFSKRREQTLLVLSNMMLSDCLKRNGPPPKGSFALPQNFPRAQLLEKT